jgi:hypothetical protein
MSEKVNDQYPGKSKPLSDEQLKAMATAQYEAKQKEESVQVHDFPTEIIDLPSKGLPYAKSIFY